MDSRPIGVFDSGLGGLTVLRQIKSLLPSEDLIYLGDTARVPYGTRSKDTIIKFSEEDAKFLIKKDIKCLVIACNTSSAYAGNTLKRNLNLPVFDVITSAIRMAKSSSKEGKVGLIATRATVASGAYKNVVSVACPLFVPFIEEGETSGKALELVAKKYLKQFSGTKIDTLILGCTHYPIIKKTIQKEVGRDIDLIDPGIELAKDLKIYLKKYKMLSKNGQGNVKYYVTDYNQRFLDVAEMFLNEHVKGKIEKVTL